MCNLINYIGKILYGPVASMSMSRAYFLRKVENSVQDLQQWILDMSIRYCTIQHSLQHKQPQKEGKKKTISLPKRKIYKIQTLHF